MFRVVSTTHPKTSNKAVIPDLDYFVSRLRLVSGSPSG